MLAIVVVVGAAEWSALRLLIVLININTGE